MDEDLHEIEGKMDEFDAGPQRGNHKPSQEGILKLDVLPGFFCFFKEYVDKKQMTFYQCYEKVFRSSYELNKIRNPISSILSDSSLNLDEQYNKLNLRAGPNETLYFLHHGQSRTNSNQDISKVIFKQTNPPQQAASIVAMGYVKDQMGKILTLKRQVEMYRKQRQALLQQKKEQFRRIKQEEERRKQKIKDEEERRKRVIDQVLNPHKEILKEESSMNTTK